jgi:hypothetical protein
MGLFIGTFIEAAVVLLYNVFCRWRGCSLLIVEWWMLIPFPLIFAIFMARAIASLHLEDY